MQVNVREEPYTGLGAAVPNDSFPVGRTGSARYRGTRLLDCDGVAAPARQKEWYRKVFLMDEKTLSLCSEETGSIIFCKEIENGRQ